MDCRDAEFYLRLRHPGRDEFEPEVAAALDRHLAGCSACFAAERLLTGFERAVAKAMKAVPVPGHLRDQLFAAAGARRGAQLRRRAYRLAAAAASLLVTAGLAVGLYSATRPQPDAEGIVLAGDELADPRQAAEMVKRFLDDERLPPLPLPDQFDYGLFFHAGIEKVKGREVPVITFHEHHAPGWVKVYAFRDTSFDTKSLRDAQASHCTAKVYPARAAGTAYASGVTYVVVHTGPDLTPFLRGRGGPAAQVGLARWLTTIRI
jgi:hypothetical protein